MPEHGVGAEHPLNDRLQNVFLLVFLVVWAADSFFLHFALNLLGLVWLLVTAPLGVLTLTFGVYLTKKSMALVFHNETGGLIDWGVYGYVRHPMYLAIALILLGFAISTLSLLAFIVLAAFLLFLDRMATYEEQDLTQILGQQYTDYQKRVPKWLPTKRK